MRISLVGGIDRLQRHYLEEAQKAGVDLKIHNRLEVGLSSKLRQAEAVVLFTSKISHKARMKVMSVAQSQDIPVFMCHNCGVCALRDCLVCVKNGIAKVQ